MNWEGKTTILSMLLCACLGLSVATPVTPLSANISHHLPDPVDPPPTQSCKICRHQLQKLGMAMSSWSTLINTTVSAQQQHIPLQLNEDEYSFNQVILEKFDAKANEDDCHKATAAMKNAVWSLTQEALKLDATRKDLYYLSMKAMGAQRDLYRHSDNSDRNWAVFDNKLEIFYESFFLKYNDVLGKAIDDTMRQESNEEEERSMVRLMQFYPHYAGDKMDFVVDSVFRKEAPINRALIKRVVGFGEKVWDEPIEQMAFHKKVALKLSQLREN